ncbi:MAG: YqaA family protein [Bacteroidota bacterium]
MSLLSEWGLLGLGLLSFLAATLIPFSSEAAVAGAIALDYPPTSVLIVASIGNGLACLLNYGIGYQLAPWTQSKLANSRSGRWALALAYKYKYWVLALSWLPVIGDPITLAAGLIRMRFVPFAILVIGLRIARYAIIIGIIMS